jgi:ribosomal protein L28
VGSVTQAIKTIDQRGVEAVVAQLRARGENESDGT